MSLVTFPRQFLVDVNGRPRVGAKAYFYRSGTNTPIVTYTTAAYDTPHSNPVLSLGGGLFPAVYVNSEDNPAYKIVVTDANDVELYSNDAVPALGFTEADLASVLTQSTIGGLLYPQTVAESAAGVVPVNSAKPGDDFTGRLYLGARFGFTPSASLAAKNQALQDAIEIARFNSGTGLIIELPAGVFDFDVSLVFPSNVQFVGQGKGFASHTSTRLNYGGNGIALQVGAGTASQTAGFYSRFADFSLTNDGTGTIGVYASANHFEMERVTIMPAVATGFSQAGYRCLDSNTVYSHFLRGCYIYGNKIGAHFPRGNNFVVERCFIESNDFGIRAGDVDLVTNLVVCNGTVIQVFGDLRGAETLNSICIDVHDGVGVKGFVCRDSYFEVAGAGEPAAIDQLAINLRRVDGAVIDGNYIYGGGQASCAINCQAGARAVTISGNHFASFFGHAVREAAGSSVQVGLNSAVSPTPGVIDRAMAAVPASLTVVPGTGGASYEIEFWRSGNRIEFEIRISVTGTATTQAAAGATYFKLPNPMPQPVSTGTCVAASDGSDNYGVGIVGTNGRVYPPSWGAKNVNIVIAGSYQAAQV